MGDLLTGKRELRRMGVFGSRRGRFLTWYFMECVRETSSSAQRQTSACEEDMLYSVGMVFCWILEAMIVEW